MGNTAMRNETRNETMTTLYIQTSFAGIDSPDRQVTPMVDALIACFGRGCGRGTDKGMEIEVPSHKTNHVMDIATTHGFTARIDD